jgi:hypothetical protein
MYTEVALPTRSRHGSTGAVPGQARDPCGEFHEIERLRDVLLDALLEGKDLRKVLGLGRQHDDRYVCGKRVVPDLHQRHPAVHARHHDVEEDDVDRLRLEHLKRLGPVSGGKDVHSVGLEAHLDHLDD